MSIFVMASASYDLDYALNNTNRIGVQIPVDFSLEKSCKCETFCV